MENERTYQTIIGILVGIIIIGGWYAFMDKGTVGSDKEGEASSTDIVVTDTEAGEMEEGGSSAAVSGPTTVANGDSVLVADQVASTNVAVGSLSLSKDGWVAVRDVNGRTLGAAWFPAGEKSNVTVPLLRTTVAGDHYQVLLYADDGDKTFDLHKETLITNADGSVAGTNFVAK